MKRINSLLIISLLLPLSFSLNSCVHEDEYENSRLGNFEALWKIMDEHYCFFDYKKQEIGLDWDEVHTRYSKMVNETMNNDQLFEVLCKMIGELKDGHVNLSSPFDYGRNWSFHEDYPLNYNDSIVNLYLGHDYRISSGLKYKILDDNIGYARCESFSNSIGSGNVSIMLEHMASCVGVIIDVRNNGGGDLRNAHTLASHFTNEKVLTGYISHKTGKGRNQFSTPEPQYLSPADEGIRWQKKVVVITNRRCFSATNDFVKCMRLFPNVTILGDNTGGGSGMPFNSEIPNGWVVRYSSVVMYDAEMRHTEFGIQPDIPLQMSGKDTDMALDTYIEEARKLLSRKINY